MYQIVLFSEMAPISQEMATPRAGVRAPGESEESERGRREFSGKWPRRRLAWDRFRAILRKPCPATEALDVSLSSASTYEEIKAAYLDNASYLEDGSAVKARVFITACRYLLLVLPKRVSKGGKSQGEEIELDPGLIQREIGQAQVFLTQANLAAAPPVHYSFENFRD